MRRVALLALPVAALVSAGACAAGPRHEARPGAGAPEAAAAEVLDRFCEAVEDGRFAQAHALLSARWRAAYTPGRLALDRAGAGPSAAEAASRVRAALHARVPLALEGDRAVLPLGGGRAAVAVAEAGGWRVDALE